MQNWGHLFVFKQKGTNSWVEQQTADLEKIQCACTLTGQKQDWETNNSQNIISTILLNSWLYKIYFEPYSPNGTRVRDHTVPSHKSFLIRVAAVHINILDLSGSVKLHLFSNMWDLTGSWEDVQSKFSYWSCWVCLGLYEKIHVSLWQGEGNMMTIQYEPLNERFPHWFSIWSSGTRTTEDIIPSLLPTLKERIKVSFCAMCRLLYVIY